MLSDWKVTQIERMLHEEKLSQRETARRSGVSRGTVRCIAAGRHRRRAPSEEGFANPNSSPQRCPECGGRVHMPCLGCQLRRMIRERRLPLPGGTAKSLASLCESDGPPDVES